MSEINIRGNSSISGEDWRDDKPSLIQSQRHVLETGLNSDVVVKVRGGGVTGPELIRCHSFVLMSRSAVFQTMLEGRWGKCAKLMKDVGDKGEVIDLSKNPTVTGHAFRAFLRVRILESHCC
jgi:hypothetical protein